MGFCEQPSNFSFVYDEQDSLWDKVNKIAKKIYRASEVTADAKVRNQIKKLQEAAAGCNGNQQQGPQHSDQTGDIHLG